ncbi:hypothetical protein JQS43_23770 [Natronosporangium hydrolyticum]|uniref:Uncharacterized protein n=1 Tax=Natronosporangium hydrolyticum TaxID=2811111 RepID=A0A895YE72_9ACTN|nr:hypothetical protein [Natronosporangium hydrolyticum]QSB14465.1 hypothetical protein JQS43_23770 [Natronosporangium hydrolyticum]
MDEQRQPDGPTHAEAVPWRVNGAQSAIGVHGAEPDWSASGPAREGATEPLTLLSPGPEGGPEARHRSEDPERGADADTPASGVPVVEPPLWREAARWSPSPNYRGEYHSEYASSGVPYPSAPEAEPGSADDSADLRWAEGDYLVGESGEPTSAADYQDPLGGYPDPNAGYPGPAGYHSDYQEYPEADYQQADYGQPQYSQPDYSQSQYAHPGYAQPEYAQPEYAQPQYAQPAEPAGGYREYPDYRERPWSGAPAASAVERPWSGAPAPTATERPWAAEPPRAPQPARPESRAEPARPESRAEPARAEPARAEPARAEPARAEPARAEPARAEARAEPARAEARAEPARAEARAEPARGGPPARSAEPRTPEQFRPAAPASPARSAAGPPTAPVPEPRHAPSPPSPRSGDRRAPEVTSGLPQRVPAEPDVPVPPISASEGDGGGGLDAGRDRWTAPELAWIANQLRRDDVPGEVPPEQLDVDGVMSAVQEVPGVRSAAVRPNPNGIHTLRLDLADDADPGEVSRAVARLLLERMGLSATDQLLAAPEALPTSQPEPASTRQPWSPPHQRTSQEEGALPPQRGQPETLPPQRGQPETLPPQRGQPDTLPPQRGQQSQRAPQQQRTPEQQRAPQQEQRAAPAHPVGEPGQGPAADPASPPSMAEYEALAQLGQLPPELPWGVSLPGQATPEAPEPVSRPLPPASRPGPRVLIDHVQVSTFGLDATVEVRLTAGARRAAGLASGPAVDSYLVRLSAVAAAKAIDLLLREADEPAGPSRCFIEHTGVVNFGNTEVAVAVVLLVCGGWVEQLTGSALVDGDPRQAVVRATLSAVNRRLEALLS